MNEPKPNSRKENVFNMIVKAINGESIANDEPLVETYQNQWLVEIAQAIAKAVPTAVTKIW